MYNPQIALALAEVSNQAYDSQSVEGVVAAFCTDTARAIIKRYDADTLIVGFRGTEPNHGSQWVVDFDALFKGFVFDGISCRVHAGFLHDMLQVRAQVDRFLAAQKYARLFLTGHSKGGATAVMYAATRKDVSALYTYGQPRVGDTHFAQGMDAADHDYYRVVDGDDIVPRVPPGEVGYVHCGTLVYLDGTSATMPPAMPHTSWNVVEDVAAHMMTKYLPKLAALAQITKNGAPK